MQFASALLLLSVAGNAIAIPSPDLVINLSASVAQLLGLLSVVFGGFAMSTSKGAKRKFANKSRRVGQLALAIVGLLLLVSLSSNVLQYTRSIDSKNVRLHTNLVRKSVENGATVGDSSLKTLSFSEQQSHPRGVTTQTLAELLSSDQPLNLIDVREDEEYEVGSIEGAHHMRYPDVLAQSSLVPETGNTLFLCYSGNRSSELCTEFTKQGRSCNFMVGGYEKWLSESRPLNSETNISIDELRKLPTFKSKDVLLDTPDVRALVQNEQAEFIDVRYPSDFVKNHLPSAHNITMRALGTSVLDERISALPDKPLIAACYDKRSCFYSQVIGLRLERAGKDFRGRYTVPHEYFLPSGNERAHVSAWKQSQQQITLASIVVTPLRSLLDALVSYFGHYVTGLLAVIILIRLLLLPLALKAERDTTVQKSLSARINALKAELGDHPRALSEATIDLYRRYKIRPVINMLASLFQLGLMLLFYSAVSQSAENWSHTFAWLNSAAQPDPLLVLPVLASALFIAVLTVQSPPKSRKHLALLVLGGSALLWMLQALGAAVNLYLAISMIFLIAQSLLFKRLGQHRGWATAGADKTGSIPDTGLIPLSQAHFLPDSTGKKAARLGELIDAGYNVPDGFVFTSIITNRTRNSVADTGLLSRQEAKLLNQLWRKLKTDKVAVRSSGANEDGVDNSFAGVYESILNVNKDTLLSSVRQVYASLCSDRSAAYTQHVSGDNTDIDQGGVVVQKMVPAEYAGVMFTEHPNNTGAMMIEMVSGLGEDLVGGNVTPDTYVFGKLTSELHRDEGSGTETPAIDVQALLAIGRELEALFAHPQDIEWAYCKGQFYLLQTRDITRSITVGSGLKNLAEQERRKLLNYARQTSGKKRAHRVDSASPVFIQNELSELLPRPTPLSADFMERLWSSGGSTDLACQQLSIPYQVTYSSVPYLTTVFGWTYINKLEESRRLGKGPGAFASFNLARDAEAVEHAFKNEFLPQFQIEMVERSTIALDLLPLPTAVTILSSWINRFIEDTYRQAEIINISADYHIKTALAKCESANLEPTHYLNSHEETVVSKAMALLSGDVVSNEQKEEFLRIFGHRAPLDYELSQPRFNEDKNMVDQYISRSSSERHSEYEHIELPENKVLAISIQRARSFQRLKEDAKHYCLIELAQIRQLLLAIDQGYGLQGRIFQLTVEEVLQLSDDKIRTGLQAVADERFAAAQKWKTVQLPATLSIRDIECIDMLTGALPNKTVLTALSGKRVAGDQEVTGQVRVITDVSEIDAFKPGEILVARMTDPTWYPLFSRASGIVTEVGGWLSHAAIVAREFDLPAIVGVSGICQCLQTGDLVTLKLDGSIEKAAERRQEDSLLRKALKSDDQLTAREVSTTSEHICQVYHLTEEKLNNFHRRMATRATKNRLLDRRSEPRFLASGEMQLDRRAANRAAILKKAS